MSSISRSPGNGPASGVCSNQQADLAALPFGDGSFDAIYSERVFQHLDNPAAVMSELFRVLRRGGCIVVADARPSGDGR